MNRGRLWQKIHGARAGRPQSYNWTARATKGKKIGARSNTLEGAKTTIKRAGIEATRPEIKEKMGRRPLAWVSTGQSTQGVYGQERKHDFAGKKKGEEDEREENGKGKGGGGAEKKGGGKKKRGREKEGVKGGKGGKGKKERREPVSNPVRPR